MLESILGSNCMFEHGFNIELLVEWHMVFREDLMKEFEVESLLGWWNSTSL